MKLYELTDSYKQVDELLTSRLEEGLLIDSETIEMLKETLESIQDSLDIKVENTVKFIANLEAHVESVDAEIKRLKARKTVYENSVKNLRNYVLTSLKDAGIRKAGIVRGASITNGRKTVHIVNEKAIPAKYREPVPDKISKTEIMRDLNAGIKVEGAQIQDGSPSLRLF